MTVREFIGKSTSYMTFIIAKQDDIFAQEPIYICDSVAGCRYMPIGVRSLKVSRYAYKEVKQGICYIIVNTYEEEEHETNNQES